MARDLLDLHGCRAEEIPDKVDKFIVDAQNAGLPRVKIMTGKGKGIVQKEVIAYLKLGKYPWKFETNARKETNEGILVVQV
jgi:dsDNA-specific endonuclease/ATPase MutS2